MAKRLYMTSADYLAIAISPALIMALVGSLVFFLLEVLYVGDYEARLTYVFALFVFAAVLVSRISIEDGREYASLFALPLGLATFLVLVKFVEHPGPWSHLINLAMMLLVWWCADKLTWDCTLIDDNEDASGEGLLQRVGVDDGAAGRNSATRHCFATSCLKVRIEPKADVPLVAPVADKEARPRARDCGCCTFRWRRCRCYGIGQHWIPADGCRPPAIRVCSAACLCGVGVVAVGNDELSRFAAVSAAASRGNAKSDGSDLGRRGRGIDWHCHVFGGADSAPNAEYAISQSSVAGTFTRGPVVVAKRRWKRRTTGSRGPN